jgi:hydrogenase-4 membrane subunit HyfE
MLYWNIADFVALVVLALAAVSMYLSYGLTRITGGAPRAWYVIIAAFAVLLIRGVAELYFDVITPATSIDIGEESILLVVMALFAVGLALLARTFRKISKVAEQGSE